MESFGRRIIRAESIAALAAMEKVEGRSDGFALLDALIGDLLVRSLHGERIITMIEDSLYINTVTINGLTALELDFLNETFSRERLQSRGSWFVPDKITLKAGFTNFAWYFSQLPRFVHSASAAESGKVLLDRSAEAVFLWAVLAPLFEKLFRSFVIRGELSGTLSHAELLRAWEDVMVFCLGLGFQEMDEMRVFRPGGGWHNLRNSGEKIDAKRQLLTAFAREVRSSMGVYYRLIMARSLAEQYYKKTKADGRVKRNQSLTKPFQPILAGFFGGDWLKFLGYLGEEPHPDEQIITALPKPQLKVGGAERVADIAAKQGLPVEEVQRIAAAFWHGSEGKSPVEERTACLKDYWREFDDLHTKQQPGMKSLWGLVQESNVMVIERDGNSPWQPGLYLELLSPQLIAEIERLWGTVMLTKWPDRIVSEPSQHYLMAQTFGQALNFWHGCGLTAWFLCEGPSSRTDMAGLAHYYRREIAALKEMGAPIDDQLFEELIAAEKRLGPAEPIERQSSSVSTDFGITITTSLTSGSRRAGFENLREIITRYRGAWAKQYLDQYLRVRWETEINAAAKSFSLLLGDKSGKAPTLKQFAKSALLPTNHWFGGDISSLYGAIGEVSPAKTERRSLIPADKVGFVRNVMNALPSRTFEMYNGWIPNEQYRERYRRELAELGLKYFQLKEALGHSPEMKEMGERFNHLYKVIDDDKGKAWAVFQRILEQT